MPNLSAVLDRLNALEGAYAPATLQALRATTNRYATSTPQGLDTAFPITPDRVVHFIESISTTCRPKTIHHKVRHLQFIQKLSGWPPFHRDIKVRHALKKEYRKHGSAQRQVFGITHELRDAMIAATDTDSLAGYMERALIRTGYETLFRGQELRQLCFENLKPRSDGSLLIHLPQSKTDPCWNGFWTVVSPACRTLIQQWQAASGLNRGIIFRQIRDDMVSDQPLTKKTHLKRYRELAKATGLPDKLVNQIGTHSMRVGGSQDMLKYGYSMAQIMRRGNWQRPEMVARYTEATALQPMF